MPREEAQTLLLEQAARAVGVGTADDLADYYRIRMPQARPLMNQLADAGRIIAVEVEGWSRPALPPSRGQAASPGRRPDVALPIRQFDLVPGPCRAALGFSLSNRDLTPEARRIHGYYVLPFLLDGDLVARVDLKTDRKAGALMVKGAFAEGGVDRVRVGRELRVELEEIAVWLGMNEVTVSRNGDLAPFL